MTAKQKARQLVSKFRGITGVEGKECALLCCDEVLGYMGADRGYVFWTKVKEEIKWI